jgi:hypothetical protein
MLSISIRWIIQPYTRQGFSIRAQKWMHKRTALECCHSQKGHQRNLEAFHEKRARSERSSSIHEVAPKHYGVAMEGGSKANAGTGLNAVGLAWRLGKTRRFKPYKNRKSPSTSDQKERRGSWQSMLPCRLSRTAGFSRGSSLHPKAPTRKFLMRFLYTYGALPEKPQHGL